MAKRLKFKKVLACIMATLMLGSAVSISAFATENGSTSTSIIGNVQSIGHYEKNDQGQDVFVYDDESLLLPNSVNADTVLPAKYDLRNVDGKSYVTSVKNQGSTGTCWAFATMAALESNILKQGNASASDLDLSERHLAWYAYHGQNNSDDVSMYAGQDSYIPMTWEEYKNKKGDVSFEEKVLTANNIDKDAFASYQKGALLPSQIYPLARGYGVVDESELPFESAKYESCDYLGFMGEPATNTQTQSNISLQKSEIMASPCLNGTYSQEAVDNIKNAIYTTGAMTMTYYNSSNANFWKGETNSYYCYDNTLLPNHAVCIVGWDDDFSADNFATKPAGNGAFIIKNSWGTNWGDKGYFYISYYDTSVREPTTFIAENNKYENKNTKHDYENIYQYDGAFLSGAGDLRYDTECSSANIFTSRGNENIEAIGLSTSIANVEANVKIYKDVEEGKPQSGELIYNNDFNVSSAGYTTISLDSKIYIPSGTKYSVVLTEKFMESSTKTSYRVCNESSFNEGTTTKAIIDTTPNISFVELEGVWYDVTDSNMPLYKEDFTLGGANVKVLTNKASAPDPEYYEIKATTTEGGKITPVGQKGTVYVEENEDKTFTATSDEGYKLEKFIVDGTDVHVDGNSYTFENVTKDHTIQAVFVKDNVIESIAVTAMPTKTEYKIGDELDTTGLVITATYSDGTTAEVTGYTLSELDSTTAGEKTITVTYEDKTTSFKVTVKGDEPVPTKNGWTNENGQWKYYKDGVALTSWQQLDWSGGNNWFYFDANGLMQTGWQGNIAGWAGQWFFFDGTTGAMKTGWHLLPWSLGTNWFDFRANGTMYANCTTPDGYRVDANGIWVQ